MASINTPKPKAKRSLSKKQGKYVVDTAAIINVAGEVFVLNTNVNKFYDLSGSYDDALKGDEAFDEFFLSVFDNLGNFTYTFNNKQISENLTNPENLQNIKKRAISIYIKLFGVNRLLLKPAVKIPCDARDLQILLRTLMYRREKLLDQITDYNTISTSDMKARYLRDHLLFLNQLIEKDIPGKIDCEDIDALIEGKKGPSFGNLTDENILKLLNIFAYLIAQGRDPIQFFENKNPMPVNVLTKIGLKDAPTLEDYLGQIEIEGEDSNEYVKQEFTPTMKKVRDIIYGNDLTSELERLENELNIKADPNSLITNRIDTIIKAINDISSKAIADTNKCYKDLKETQDISFEIIKQLKDEAAQKGSVTGILQYAVLADIDFKLFNTKMSNYFDLYYAVEASLRNLNILDDPIYFSGVYITNINEIFEFMSQDNLDYFKNIIANCYNDDLISRHLVIHRFPEQNIKQFYNNIRILLKKISNAYQNKIQTNKNIITKYTLNVNNLLVKLRTINENDTINYLDTKNKIDKLADESYNTFTTIKDKYEKNRKALVDIYNKLKNKSIENSPVLTIDQNNRFLTRNLDIQNPNPEKYLPQNEDYKLGNLLPTFIDISLINPQEPSLSNIKPFIYKPFLSQGRDKDDIPTVNVLTNDNIHMIQKNTLNRLIENILTYTLANYKNNLLIPSLKHYLQSLQDIIDFIFLTIKHEIYQVNFYYTRYFYKKIRYTQKKIHQQNDFEINPTDLPEQKIYKMAMLYALESRADVETETIKLYNNSCDNTNNILKLYSIQAGGGHRARKESPVVSPKLIKQMIRQMKNNVLSGEVIEENDNLESLMEIYGEQTVDSTLGICSLSMLFLLLEVALTKQNMNELREAIYSPLQGLQKDKAYEFLQDFFSSFQDLDHSNELSLQLKKESLDIPEKATKQAKEILASMFAIESAPKQYANEFIVFLQVVRTVLEENSPILEELGCLIPM